MANTIKVEIDLETGELVKDLKKVEKKSKKSGEKAGKNYEKGMSKGFSGINGRLLSLGAALAGVFGAGKVIAAAARQEDAVNALNTSLKTAGTFSEEASQSFQDMASSMQSMSVFGDEVILQQAALARNFTKTNEEAEKLTTAAVELSAATGMSLDSAVKNLGKTFGGLTGELGESVPALRGLSVEALKSGAALDFVLNRFGGSAEAQINTFSGAMKQMSNIFGDLLENIGGLFTKSPVVVAMFKALSKALFGVSESVKELGDKDIMGDIVKNIIEFGLVVNKFMIVPLELAFNAAKVSFNGIRFLTQELAKSAVATAYLLSKLKDSGSETTKTLLLMWQSMGEVSKDIKQDMVNSTDAILDFSGALKVDEILNKMKRVADGATALKESVTENFSKAGAKVKGVTVDMAKYMNDFRQKGLVAGMTAVGAALANGENAFSAFGNAVMGVLGDLAIQMGTTMISMGFALDSLKSSLLTLSGPAAIAAGAALVALGGALKALSGGSAGSATAAPAPAVTEAASVAEDVSGGDELSESIADRGPQIVLNVEGAVDPQSAGVQIANILNEAGFGSGAVLA